MDRSRPKKGLSRFLNVLDCPRIFRTQNVRSSRLKMLAAYFRLLITCGLKLDRVNVKQLVGKVLLFQSGVIIVTDKYKLAWALKTP
jgi:hypothetical protein